VRGWMLTRCGAGVNVAEGVIESCLSIACSFYLKFPGVISASAVAA
jgi:hypothetical protein